MGKINGLPRTRILSQHFLIFSSQLAYVIALAYIYASHNAPSERRFYFSTRFFVLWAIEESEWE